MGSEEPSLLSLENVLPFIDVDREDLGESEKRSIHVNQEGETKSSVNMECRMKELHTGACKFTFWSAIVSIITVILVNCMAFLWMFHVNFCYITFRTGQVG